MAKLNPGELFACSCVDKGKVFGLGLLGFFDQIFSGFVLGQGSDVDSRAKLVGFLDLGQDPDVFEFFLERGEFHGSEGRMMKGE